MTQMSRTLSNNIEALLILSGLLIFESNESSKYYKLLGVLCSLSVIIRASSAIGWLAILVQY